MKKEHVIAETLVKAAFEILDQGPWRRIYTLPKWEIVRVLSTRWTLWGADLWHLATAATLRKELPELTFLSFGQRLKQAAGGESLL